MMKVVRILCFVFISGVVFSCHEKSPDQKENIDHWGLGPFVKVDSVNPVLRPLDETRFFCPVRKEFVKWEEKDVFNPSAVLKDGKIFLLYRAEDVIGKFHGTSRIGLAESTDGMNFLRMPEPVFYPDNDEFMKYEWEGGCEDPRIVQDENGTYYMTYSAWEGTNSYMSIASSKDLKNWKKHGPCFREAMDGKYLDTWAKSGAIISRLENDKMIATKINGKYWMYWGDTDVFLATSDDLINWTPVEKTAGEEGVTGRHKDRYPDLKPIFGPRKYKFDSDLVEPGPAPIITEKGIWMIYNGRNAATENDSTLEYGTYSAGQILLDKNDPTKVIARSEDYFITPEKDYEVEGQVDRVCFVEGLVHFKDKWFLYYGTADSKIAVAVCDRPLQ